MIPNFYARSKFSSTWCLNGFFIIPPCILEWTLYSFIIFRENSGRNGSIISQATSARYSVEQKDDLKLSLRVSRHEEVFQVNLIFVEPSKNVLHWNMHFGIFVTIRVITFVTTA